MRMAGERERWGSMSGTVAASALPADGGFLVRDPRQTAVHFTST